MRHRHVDVERRGAAPRALWERIHNLYTNVSHIVKYRNISVGEARTRNVRTEKRTANASRKYVVLSSRVRESRGN